MNSKSKAAVCTFFLAVIALTFTIFYMVTEEPARDGLFYANLALVLTLELLGFLSLTRLKLTGTHNTQGLALNYYTLKAIPSFFVLMLAYLVYNAFAPELIAHSWYYLALGILFVFHGFKIVAIYTAGQVQMESAREISDAVKHKNLASLSFKTIPSEFKQAIQGKSIDATQQVRCQQSLDTLVNKLQSLSPAFYDEHNEMLTQLNEKLEAIHHCIISIEKSDRPVDFLAELEVQCRKLSADITSIKKMM